MSLFDLSSVVAVVSESTATITRYSSSGYGSDGKAAAKVVGSTSSARVSFQPVSKNLDRAAEGFNEKAILFNVFCGAELRNGDRLTVSGVNYEVERVEPWNAIGNYCEAMVRQLDPGES